MGQRHWKPWSPSCQGWPSWWGGEWKIGKIENQFWFNFIRTYTTEKNDKDNDDSSNDGDDDDNTTLPVAVSQDLLGDIDDDDSIYQLISLAVPWFEEAMNTKGSPIKICETM